MRRFFRFVRRRSAAARRWCRRSPACSGRRSQSRSVARKITVRPTSASCRRRPVLAIRAEGGVRLKDGSRVMPDPILVGRNAQKVEALARTHGVSRWTTDLDAALADRRDELYFDAVVVGRPVPTRSWFVPGCRHCTWNACVQSGYRTRRPNASVNVAPASPRTSTPTLFGFDRSTLPGSTHST